MTDGIAYEQTAIKAPKAKNIKATAKKQAVKSLDQVNALTLQWVLFKRTVKFIWVNKVPITINAFLIENTYLVIHYTHFFAK